MSRKKLDAKVWIALSEAGKPCPFIGYAFEAKMLRASYAQKFGHTLKAAGYRVVRVRLTELEPPNDR
jgi:hypothetical protein